jgi:hypothetical protein
MAELNSLEWHCENYINWKESLDKHEERTLRELEKIKEDRERLNFFKFQIEEANKEGKLSFDRDKFRVKRKC